MARRGALLAGELVELVSSNPGYWEARKNFLYYQVVRILAEGLIKGADSVLDVGSSGCPYLDWFPGVTHRTSLDLRKPYVASGVQSIKSDFLKWQADRPYDLVLCLQVLEHVPDAGAFAQKLLASGTIILVSVPYKWAKGVASHVHDPVDEAKMRQWFGREPNFSYVCAEVETGARRLICVYDSIPQPWRSLRQRAGRIDGSAPVRTPTLAGRARRAVKRLLGRG